MTFVYHKTNEFLMVISFILHFFFVTYFMLLFYVKPRNCIFYVKYIIFTL